jgi:predicted HTH transcriptional regulator
MKFHNLRKRIIEFIRKNRAVTTSEVASHFQISWNTAEKYLMELILEDKVIRLKKQGVNIWLLK